MTSRCICCRKPEKHVRALISPPVPGERLSSYGSPLPSAGQVRSEKGIAHLQVPPFVGEGKDISTKEESIRQTSPGSAASYDSIQRKAVLLSHSSAPATEGGPEGSFYGKLTLPAVREATPHNDSPSPAATGRRANGSDLIDAASLTIGGAGDSIFIQNIAEMRPPNIIESDEAATRHEIRKEYLNETRPTTTSSSKPPPSSDSSSPISSRAEPEGPDAGYIKADTPFRWSPESLTRVFIFVNPTSGGNAAGAFTKAGLWQARTKDPNIEYNIFDIRDGPSGHKPGFQLLKEAVETSRCFAVMAGGDGTVLWGMSELWEHGIDDSKISIGVIPYGTGNDFARAMSWSKYNALNPFNHDMQSLTTLCTEWLAAPTVLHDLWDIEVEIDPLGSFKQIDSKTRLKKVLTDASTGANLFKLEKKLCNYFSMGIESRIGVGFDRNRSTNQFRNKIVYVNEGFKKQFFHHGVSVPKLLRKMVVYDEGESNPFVVFDNDDPNARHLYRCSSLIASNIPSYASGLDLWKFARRYGLKKTGARLRDDKDVQDLLKAPQFMGDQKLEWLSFSGIVTLGVEQIIEGMGKRVHQGKGPFELTFYPQAEDSRVYFQIDGEFYQMTMPRRLWIRHFKSVNCLASAVSERAITKTASI